MGLKTKNYVSKSTGIVLPEAYAVLRTLVIEADNSARAVFAIQASRENAEKYTPLDKVEVRFTWDRKIDPAMAAYSAAKVQVITKDEYKDGSVETVTEHGTLYGWENDII